MEYSQTPTDTDTKGTIESVRAYNRGVRAKRDEFRENIKAFFSQGQSQPSVIIRRPYKGGFPLSRNFNVRTWVKFTFANKIEAIYERWRVNVKVKPHSTSSLSSTLYILPLYNLRE